MRASLFVSAALLLTAFTFYSCEQLTEDSASVNQVTEGSSLSKGVATVQIAMSGNLIGESQIVSGRNDARSIVAKGDYVLTMNLNLSALTCPAKPGTIPWESGLVAFVQSNTPRVGTLDLHYDKSGETVLGSVDSWTTEIGSYTYVFQVFGWSSKAHTVRPDGSTLIEYRHASVEVFKKKGGKYISREQCFNEDVNYDVVVK